jgi:hypothetical protein
MNILKFIESFTTENMMNVKALEEIFLVKWVWGKKCRINSNSVWNCRVNYQQS